LHAHRLHHAQGGNLASSVFWPGGQIAQALELARGGISRVPQGGPSLACRRDRVLGDKPRRLRRELRIIRTRQPVVLLPQALALRRKLKLGLCQQVDRLRHIKTGYTFLGGTGRRTEAGKNRREAHSENQALHRLLL